MIRRFCSGLCWFGAACLSIVAFVLVLAGIGKGLMLTLLAGAAVAGMIVLIGVAFRTERRGERQGQQPL